MSSIPFPKTTVAKESQSLKAREGMVLTPSPITTEVKASQSQNILSIDNQRLAY